MRHKVGRHRYGIAGFPCLYLGDSLELCVSELRTPPNQLRRRAAAEFAVKSGTQVNLLDFGYRPGALADIAHGREIEDAKPNGKANPALIAFLVSYATCWPLIAASSIKVSHDKSPFIHEYIVPQLILQWLMQNSDVHGIRYFSSRFNPEPKGLKGTVNYVFPAVHPGGPQHGFSPKLKSLFEWTDPITWGPWTEKKLRKECRAKQTHLASLPKSGLL